MTRSSVVWAATSVFLLVVVSPPLTAQTQPYPELKKLRVLLVIDNDAPRIGKVVARDEQHITKFLKEGLPADRYSVDRLPNKTQPLNRQAIMDYYANIQSGPDEALLFFYVGHGGTTENDHLLTVTGDGRGVDSFSGERCYSVSRKALVTSMQTTRAGLIVVLTACCSNYIKPDRSTQIYGEARPSFSVPEKIKPVIRSLFFQHRGIVDITAAPPGEFAIGDGERGTYLTSTFVDLTLRDDLLPNNATNQFITWKDFHEKLSTDMLAAAKASKQSQQVKQVAGEEDKFIMAAYDFQRAYAFQLADESKVPRKKWLFGAYYNEHDGKGLKLISVYPRSPAGRAGFQAGDILLRVDGQVLEKNFDFTRIVEGSLGEVKIDFIEARTRRPKSQVVTLERLDQEPASAVHSP